MKLARFAAGGPPRFGRIEGDQVLEMDGPRVGACAPAGRRLPLGAVRIEGIGTLRNRVMEAL
jgi:hypothetical protein